jgi:hypothetical protein|tara:strand:+ start:324 stop:560 length:237 start_codon:yes stop_codon:yes gene_type:complete
MIKIWFMLVLVSMPNAPSVKYNGFIYSSEEDCQVAKYELHEEYNKKSTEYKSTTVIDSYCVEFNSFPIRGLNKINLGV